MSPIDVTCAIILKEDKILVVQRSEAMRLPLKWEFPGGKVNPDESEEDCILRELREELNINVTIKGRLLSNVHDYGTFSIRLIPFVVEYVSGEVALTEHRAVAEVSKEDLGELDFAAADLPVLEEFVLRYSSV